MFLKYILVSERCKYIGHNVQKTELRKANKAIFGLDMYVRSMPTLQNATSSALPLDVATLTTVPEATLECFSVQCMIFKHTETSECQKKKKNSWVFSTGWCTSTKKGYKTAWWYQNVSVGWTQPQERSAGRIVLPKWAWKTTPRHRHYNEWRSCCYSERDYSFWASMFPRGS